jgi:hypothetical protein
MIRNTYLNVLYKSYLQLFGLKNLLKHVDLMSSEDGQLTETCKGSKYIQIESHWTVFTIIIL